MIESADLGDATDTSAAGDTSDTTEAIDAADALGASAPTWSKAASLGTVRGRVFDAATGAAVDGTVTTTASCVGKGCTKSGKQYVTTLRAGTFSFDASATEPAKLTLRPDTAFRIDATGYKSLVVAHGPKSSSQSDAQGKPYTELPALYVCPQAAADQDFDGICDAAEQKYGTKVDSTDSDDDGLSDSLELLGHPAEEGTPVYDIAALGATPLHKDVIVAVRYTKTSQLDVHAFPPVINAFAAAPRDNPDGTTGIRLTVLVDERAITGLDDKQDLSPVWSAFDALKRKYFGERPLAFHYALFANRYSGGGSSGVSRGFGASDFVVTLAGFNHGTTLQQAGTFMHELGHNLGLHHGGYDDKGGYDDDIFKAQYFSIMNYNYQMDGLERGGTAVLDYARVSVGAFDENAVDETKPFSPAGNTSAQELATYRNPRICIGTDANNDWVFATVPADANGAFDLNRNQKIEPNVPINFRFSMAKPTDANYELKAYAPIVDDWNKLAFGGGASGYVGDMTTRIRRRDVVDSEPTPPCLAPGPEAPLADASDMNAPSNDGSMNTPDRAPPEPSSPTPENGSDEASDDTDLSTDSSDSAADSAASDNPGDGWPASDSDSSADDMSNGGDSSAADSGDPEPAQPDAGVPPYAYAAKHG